MTPVAVPAQPSTAELPPRIATVQALPDVWALEANVEWLVDDMLPRASVNLISAESGTGKTWLAYAIAGAVAHGMPFLGRATSQVPVLYVDGENPLSVVKRNLTDLGIDATDNLHVWGGWVGDPPPRPNDPRVIQFAREHRPLLIWDSLVEFAHADEQSSNEMRVFLDYFRALAHLGATIIALHHTGKSKTSKEYRGSTDIKASVDTAYVVTGKPRNGQLHRLEMDPFKSRIAPGQKFGMEFEAGRGFSAISVPQQRPTVDPNEILRRIIRENSGSNGTRITDIAMSQGVRKRAVAAFLASAECTFIRGRGAEKLYTLREDVVVDLPISPTLENGR